MDIVGAGGAVGTINAITGLAQDIGEFATTTAGTGIISTVTQGGSTLAEAQVRSQDPFMHENGGDLTTFHVKRTPVSHKKSSAVSTTPARKQPRTVPVVGFRGKWRTGRKRIAKRGTRRSRAYLWRG
jgi:hypothetical protein